MKKVILILRDYRKPDDKLIEQSQVLCSTFLSNESVFTDFQPPFGVEWESLNSEAVTLLTDSAIRNRLCMYSDQLNQSIQQASEIYEIIMVYASMAFANDPAKLKEFGRETYSKEKQSKARHLKFLSDVYQRITHQPEKDMLIAKGLTLNQIQEFETLLTELENNNNIQENYKNERLALTQERIKKYNELWRRMTLVCEASKVVFRKNPAMQKIFKLYPEIKVKVSAQITK